MGVIMDKRYQVFVSSTYIDLQDERKEVMQALLELDCIPAGMELFPASNDDQWTLIKKVIDDCDYYILILAGRYGSTNDKGIGYTEMEYQYALEMNKPVISFLYKDPGEIPSAKTEDSQEGKEKLKLFRELTQKKMTRYWSNSYDLGSVVSRSMIKLIKANPAIGWVKADNVIDENSLKEILILKKENEELRQQIEVSKTQAPKGTDNLSQGDENVDITFLARWYNENNEEFTEELMCQATWDEIFAYISPHLIDELKETDIKELITSYLKDFLKDDLQEIEEYDDFYDYLSFSINDRDFQKIKVQFKAIGLIKQSKSNYWTLTEYGDYKMTQLVAIKR
jgi:hypothetical protein